jgi:autotransporter strand-loop-strand O-heptosyltransferase
MLDNIIYSFINGAKVEIKGKSSTKYLVKFIDQSTNEILWHDTITPGMWTKCSKEYFIDWKIEIWANGELVEFHNFDCSNKRVYIHLDSKALGDSIAWVPYVEEFRKQHNCKIICSTFKNFLFKSSYPEIEFITPTTTVKNIYAQYNIGWFNNSYKNPRDPYIIPLQQTATDILGLPFKEIKPNIGLVTVPFSKKEKYITLSMQSTAQSKYWNYKGGWQQVVDFLNSQGYKVICIDKHSTFGVKGCMNSIPKNAIDKTGCDFNQAAAYIKGAKFHLGISSGLSWLSWALGTHVVMISSFSKPLCEFTTNITRIYTDTKYSGFFNTTEYKFDSDNWHWNPFLKISTPEEWHDFETITPKQVINKIKQIL